MVYYLTINNKNEPIFQLTLNYMIQREHVKVMEGETC